MNNASSKQKESMEQFSLSYDSLVDIASKETIRIDKKGIPEQVHTILLTSDSAAMTDEEPDTNAKRKPGRPKGSSKKKTEEFKMDRKSGRPKGSKNKPNMKRFDTFKNVLGTCRRKFTFKLHPIRCTNE